MSTAAHTEVAANLRTVDLLEHLPHRLDIIMIEESSFAVILILFERRREGVRHVDDLAVVLSQKYAYNAL